jgi:hypothetical protein
MSCALILRHAQDERRSTGHPELADFLHLVVWEGKDGEMRWAQIGHCDTKMAGLVSDLVVRAVGVAASMAVGFLVLAELLSMQ